MLPPGMVLAAVRSRAVFPNYSGFRYDPTRSWGGGTPMLRVGLCSATCAAPLLTHWVSRHSQRAPANALATGHTSKPPR
jgi:hypothetical protein